MNEKKLALLEHLRELRSRLIRSLGALLLGTGISLFFAKEIFRFLQKPLKEVLPLWSSFIATSPIEPLVTYLKVSLLSGLFLSLPIVLYETWKFVIPGLYQQEKRWVSFFVISSTILFVGGALFGYFVIFPIGFRFFATVLEGTGIRLLPQMKDYLGFITRMLLTFGLLFEIPLILLLLSRIGLLRHHHLTHARRYVVVGAFLAAGVLTPGPDVLSQFLVALPLLGLYELSGILIWALEKRMEKKKAPPSGGAFK